MKHDKSLIFNFNRWYLQFTIIVVLFAITGYLSYVISPELSKNFGYDNSYIIFIKQIIPILVGIIIMVVLTKLNSKVWFNRIGLSIFIISFILLILMLIVPTSITSYIDGKKLYIVFGNISINPMFFFTVGSLWLISWIDDIKEEIKITNITIFILMIITAGFCIEFNNMGTFLMLEAFFISMLLYINGINRFTIISLVATFGAGILFILMAEYRIQRIKSWFTSSSDFMTTLTLEKSLHENILLSLINNIGIVFFIFVLVLFLLLIRLVFTHTYQSKSYKIFAVGVVFLLLVNLTLNVLYTFGLSPIYPPAIYLFGYGASIIIASSIMMGMLMMTMRYSILKYKKDEKQ